MDRIHLNQDMGGCDRGQSIFKKSSDSCCMKSIFLFMLHEFSSPQSSYDASPTLAECLALSRTIAHTPFLTVHTDGSISS